MNNSIVIAYPSDSADQIKVLYTIEQAEDRQTITCVIDSVRIPLWLQLRKFSISSLQRSGNYVLLYDEINNSRNMDTSLFIDQVYSSIMKIEHFRYS